ncbi:MAG: hypothetical protein LBI10_04020, partial [Deltaproteobacteria bacterium]|nr:hypothetical protein [Deltaproteobacteria bacterium]
NEKIDALLSKKAQEALDDIEKRNYPSIVSFHAKEITSLGLAIYGNGTKMVALLKQIQSKSVNKVKLSRKPLA